MSISETPKLRVVASNPDIDEPSLSEMLAGDQVDPVSGAREQLAQVVDDNKKLAQQAERIAELEVTCIEADLAATQTAELLQMSPQDAVKLGTLLERKRGLEDELRALLGREEDTSAEPEDQETRRVRAIDALQAWLDAPTVKDSKRAATLARVVLLMAVIILGWAAYILHPAMLVLVIPVAAPISMFLQRGENTRWRRMGAKQRFEGTGLKGPTLWEEQPIRERLQELRQELDAIRKRTPGVPAPSAAHGDELDARYAELSYEQVDIDLNLQRAVDAAGRTLEDLSDAELDALNNAAGASRARKRLEITQRERDALRRESESRKDEVFAFLSSRDAAPAGGRADVAALSEALSSLSPGRY
jgi:hypothetical protein